MLKGDHYCLNKAFKLLFNTLPSLNIPVFLKLENVILTLSFLKFSNIWRKKVVFSSVIMFLVCFKKMFL